MVAASGGGVHVIGIDAEYTARHVRHTVWGTLPCEAGLCASLTMADCDDGDPCTRDWCEPEEGCVSTPWPEGTRCGTGRACKSGKCVAVAG